MRDDRSTKGAAIGGQRLGAASRSPEGPERVESVPSRSLKAAGLRNAACISGKCSPMTAVTEF